MEVCNMKLCDQCEAQIKKSRNGKPHENLFEFNDRRIFAGRKPRGFEEQDFQCHSCQAKFTQSTDKNDLAWTLWQA
jgi:hypothetical protein